MENQCIGPMAGGDPPEQRLWWGSEAGSIRSPTLRSVVGKGMTGAPANLVGDGTKCEKHWGEGEGRWGVQVLGCSFSGPRW